MERLLRANGFKVYRVGIPYVLDGDPLFVAQVDAGSSLFRGNISYGDGVLHLKFESMLSLWSDQLACSPWSQILALFSA